MIARVEDIEAYRRSKELYPRVVEYARKFPPHGFHLRDQVCRSANGIHSDMTEGYGRSPAEFKMYLTRALGSCNETRSHLEDAINAKFGDEKIGRELREEYAIVGKQTYRLRERWR